MAEYTPPDYGGYERQKADTNYKYGQDSTTNAYGRFISQQRGQRGLSDSYRGYQRQMPKQISQFGQRGLSGPGVNSGTMNRSMGNYVGDFARGYGRQQQDLTNSLQQFDLSQSNLDAWKEHSLAGIEADKQRAIARDASQLQQLRESLGGL